MSLENQDQDPKEDIQAPEANLNQDANSDLPPVTGDTVNENLEDEGTDEGESTSEDTEPKGDGKSEGNKTPGRLSKRFSKLTAERNRLKAQVEQLSRQGGYNPQLQAQYNEQFNPPQNQQNLANDTLEPDPVDYADGASDPEFVKATAQFHGKQAYHNEKRQDQISQVEVEKNQAIQDANQNWSEQATKGMSKYQDWDLAMAGINGRLDSNIQMQLMKSDIAGDLAYYLGKNPQLIQNLNSLPKESAYMELGRIASHVNGGVSSRTQKVSKMSDPMDTVNTGNPGANIEYRDDMPQKEFDKLYPVIW